MGAESEYRSELFALDKASLIERIADLAAEVETKDGILREIMLFAIHGCGTKQKDARGKQFAAIVDLCLKAGVSPDQQLQPKGGQEGEL